MVAEGIETEEQLRQLIEMQCEKGQGYFLGRPAPADEARQLIRDSALGRRSYPGFAGKVVRADSGRSSEPYVSRRADAGYPLRAACAASTVATHAVSFVA